MRRPFWVILLGFAGVLATGLFGVGRLVLHGGPASPAGSVLAASSGDASGETSDCRPDGARSGERRIGRGIELPTGAPAALSCRDARWVVAQARSHLAAEPQAVDARQLTDATVDWLDPHGLWSASPDAPLAAFLHKHEKELLRELEAPYDAGDCPIADEAGTLLAGWVNDIGAWFEEAYRLAEAAPLAEALALASEPPFEDCDVLRPARDLARDLGHTVGVVDRSYGEAVRPFVDAARSRFAPSLAPAAWARVLIAAAVRAYLPQLDPHAGWAPLDEETCLYEVDLDAVPPPRLWDHMVRTALGVRLESEQRRRCRTATWCSRWPP